MDPNAKRQVSVTVPGQNKPKPTVSGRPTVKADLVSLAFNLEFVCPDVDLGCFSVKSFGVGNILKLPYISASGKLFFNNLRTLITHGRRQLGNLLTQICVFHQNILPNVESARKDCEQIFLLSEDESICRFRTVGYFKENSVLRVKTLFSI